MKKMKFPALLLLFTGLTFTAGHALADPDSASVTPEIAQQGRKLFIGSSLFLLGNIPREDRPYYFMVNVGCRLSANDIVFTEAITWTYFEPLGAYGSSEEHYPGKIRAYGIGIGYQRFLWKKLYMTAQATPFFQQFYDTDDKKSATGFQLYLQSRLGYRFEFINERFFVEPSVAENYWPINTGFPQGFKDVEKGKKNYYLFEPGLNFGFTF